MKSYMVLTPGLRGDARHWKFGEVVSQRIAELHERQGGVALPLSSYIRMPGVPYLVVTPNAFGRRVNRFGDVLVGRKAAWTHRRQRGVVLCLRSGSGSWYL